MESLLGWMCDVAVRGKWTVMVMCLERGIVTEGPALCTGLPETVTLESLMSEEGGWAVNTVAISVACVGGS